MEVSFMGRLGIVAVVSFLIYYLTFLTGRPALQTERDPADREASGKTTIIFSPGVLQRILLQTRALDLKDPLLESDAEPEKLFRNLERSYTGDLFTAVALSFWCFSFMLCAVSLNRSVWFGRIMAGLLIGPSCALVLGLLFTRRRSGIQSMDGSDDLMMAFVETALLLLGVAALLRAWMFPTKSSQQEFLGHLQSGYASWGESTRKSPSVALQVMMLSAIAVVLANLLVLPVYYLQISFPGFFALLLLIAVGLLAAFYIRAYMRVAATQEGITRPTLAVAFLGFRILTNTIFFTGVLSIVLSIIGIVVLSSIANLDFLETIGVLKKAARL